MSNLLGGLANIFGGVGGARAKSGGSSSSGAGAYSLQQLQQLHLRLQNFWASGDLSVEQNRNDIVEIIRQITEILIWSEKRDS